MKNYKVSLCTDERQTAALERMGYNVKEISDICICKSGFKFVANGRKVREHDMNRHAVSFSKLLVLLPKTVMRYNRRLKFYIQPFAPEVGSVSWDIGYREEGKVSSLISVLEDDPVEGIIRLLARIKREDAEQEKLESLKRGSNRTVKDPA